MREGGREEARKRQRTFHLAVMTPAGTTVSSCDVGIEWRLKRGWVFVWFAANSQL